MSMPRYLKCVTEGILESKAEVLAASFKGSKADLDQLILKPDSAPNSSNIDRRWGADCNGSPRKTEMWSA